MQPNDPDRDPVYEEFLREVTHGLPWHSAQNLLYSIEQDRKAKAAAVAKRLLGKIPQAVCSNPNHGFGEHPRFTDCEDWQG